MVSANFSSDPIHGAPPNTSSLCPRTFQGTAQQWHLLTTGPLLIGFVTILCGLINVVVFTKWRSKPSFVYLFLSLSVCEIAYAVLYVLGGFARLFDVRHSTNWPFYVAYTASYFFPRMSDIHFACISFDRWLAVEFPIFYRNRVTPKSAWYAIACTWSYSVIAGLAVSVYYSDKFFVPCNGPTGAKRSPFSLFIGGGVEFVLTVIVVIVIQSRVIYIAVCAKIKVRRNLRVVSASNRLPGLLQETSVLRTIAKSVIGCYAMVFVTVLCQLCSQVAGFFHIEKSYVAGYLLLYLEHVVPMFVYLAFYREYQNILCSIVRKHGLEISSWNWKKSKDTPTGSQEAHHKSVRTA